MRDGGLRSLFRKHLPEFHWTSIETGVVQPGVPDSNYCHTGIEGWIEFKITNTYSVPTIRPFQVAWIEQRVRAGGRVHIAIRRRHAGGPRLGKPVDELWLYPGCAVRQLWQGNMLHVQHLGQWPGGAAKWPWPAIRGVLLA